jgi:hypothetical protein
LPQQIYTMSNVDILKFSNKIDTFCVEGFLINNRG